MDAYGSSTEEVAALRRECSELIEARQAADSGSGSTSPAPSPSKEEGALTRASDPVTQEQASVSPGPSDGPGRGDGGAEVEVVGGGVSKNSLGSKTSGVDRVENEVKARTAGGRAGKGTGEGALSARRGHKAADSGRCKVSGRYNTHPADESLMDRWDGFLRASDASGKRWQQMMGAGDLGSGWGPKGELWCLDKRAREGGLVVSSRFSIFPLQAVGSVLSPVMLPKARVIAVGGPWEGLARFVVDTYSPGKVWGRRILCSEAWLPSGVVLVS